MRKDRWVGVWGLIFAAGGFYACIDSSATTRGNGMETVADAGSTGSAAPANIDKSGLLQSIISNVIAPTHSAFIAAAVELEAAVNVYADTLDEADRVKAQQAFAAAMKVWQRLEVMQVGPAGAMGLVVGGQDLRDDIYSWPTVNTCRIDQETVEGAYADPSVFQSEHVNVRGLDALEYLLFNDEIGNTCPPQNAINSSGSWDALGDVLRARAQYAKTVASLTLQRAQALQNAWSAGFTKELSDAGRGSLLFPTVQSGLNAIADAMFYLDRETKDMKLAVPAGLSDCTDNICPNALESRYAHLSKDAVLANLEGFRLLFTGGEGLGFDDWLKAAGAEELAVSMLAKIDAAIAHLSGIENATLLDALSDDKESVEQAYFAVKAITDELKSQFIGVLDLELPKAVEGDND